MQSELIFSKFEEKIMGFICCIPLVNAEENLNFRIYARQANFQ